MSNDEARALATEQPAEPIKVPAPKMQITINLMPGDQIQVTGPLENEALFDWMLKKAGQVAESWRQQQAHEAAKSKTLLGHLKQLGAVREH